MNIPELRPRGVIPMTPDKTIEWQSYDIGSLDSRLYVDPTYNSAAAQMAVKAMVDMAQHGPAGRAEAVEINRGANGLVYRDNGVVIKQPLRRHTSDEACGLAATQAMVTLGEGMRRLSGHRFNAARQYACLVAGPQAPDQTRSTILMSYVKGRTPTIDTPLPSSEQRKDIYDAAVRLCGAEEGDIFYDDTLENLKVRTFGGVVCRITKLDIWPKPNFVSKMGERPPRFF